MLEPMSRGAINGAKRSASPMRPQPPRRPPSRFRNRVPARAFAYGQQPIVERLHTYAVLN